MHVIQRLNERTPESGIEAKYEIGSTSESIHAEKACLDVTQSMQILTHDGNNRLTCESVPRIDRCSLRSGETRVARGRNTAAPKR
jgi:hypothetical protein